jgi:hypothetical protein
MKLKKAMEEVFLSALKIPRKNVPPQVHDNVREVFFKFWFLLSVLL